MQPQLVATILLLTFSTTHPVFGARVEGIIHGSIKNLGVGFPRDWSSQSGDSSDKSEVTPALKSGGMRQCDCPLNQTDDKMTSSSAPPEHPHIPRPSAAEVWGYGVLSVTLISLSSVVGVLFLPLMKHDSYEKVLMGMVGLAVGCLCGSAIFTLVPEAYGFSPDEQIEEYVYKSCAIVGAIYVFFLVERLLKISVDHRNRQRLHGSLQKKSENSNLSIKVIANSTEETAIDRRSSEACSNLHMHTKLPPADVKTHVHGHDLDGKELKDHPTKTVAWMIITGDGIVDGLGIGAAFSESIVSGLSLSIAVLCEELPHELGDLAVLLNAGMSLKRALLYNFLSACTCFAGLVVGILLGDLPDASVWIFAIAGGMFLYISLVDMLPELTHAAEKASSTSAKKGLMMLFIQNIGLVSGLVLMFLLARFKKDMNL